jgi:cytochrome c-type protein NapB
MKKNSRNSVLALVVGTVLGVLVFASTAYGQDVVSLRGQVALDAQSVPSEITKSQIEVPPMRRVYVQQPPLIPHPINGYTIDLQNNKCLICHSWPNAKMSGATKISVTHFTDRDGVELADVSPRRYFCTQCHVPQKSVKPLVQNEFMPVKSLRKQ